MASVTFAGVTVVSESDGEGCGWVYTPGQKGNAREVRRLARAKTARVAEMASNPSVHSLVLTVVGNTSFISSFRSRLESLYARGAGTLVVPDYPTVQNAVFMGDPAWSEQRRVEDGYMYDIIVELLEL